MGKLDDIMNALDECSTTELSTLATTLSDRWGVEIPKQEEWVPPPPPEEEDSGYRRVVLTGFKDGARIKVVKVVRQITNMGLKEANEATKTLPYTVLDGVPEDEAEGYRTMLENEGAVVSVEKV